MNLVVVSNRVARGKANEPMTGGLAAALLPVVEKSGAIWVGSSGRVRDGFQKEPFAEIEALGAGALAMLDLPAAHYGGYYEGFANSALWPALHSRTDLIRASQDDYLSYREVNAFMARALLRFRKPDTAFWIQDYHFLALGAELRELGVTAADRLLPAYAVARARRDRRRAASSRTDRGDAGLRSDRIPDPRRLREFSRLYPPESRPPGSRRRRHLASRQDPRSRCFRSASMPKNSRGGRQGRVASRRVAAAAQPATARSSRSASIGWIIPRDWSTASTRSTGCGPSSRRWRARYRCCRSQPPRAASIEAYGNLQSELAKLVSDVNGRHGEVDWTPIRYLNKGFSQTVLAGLYRTAQVGVVTPLHDGMNLVAKEYVAAQNPADPGVLVLSKFAGAANELDTALLVNPHDIDGMARTIATALSMPLTERRMRWEAMMENCAAIASSDGSPISSTRCRRPRSRQGRSAAPPIAGAADAAGRMRSQSGAREPLKIRFAENAQ